MRKVLVIAIALIASGSIAFAWPLAVRVNIPFEFHAGDAILPAGQYEIATMAKSLSTLMLRNMSGDDGAFVPTSPADRLQDTPAYSVSFNKYGEEYFMAGMDAGDLKVKILKTKAEKKLAGEDLKGTVIAYLIR